MTGQPAAQSYELPTELGEAAHAAWDWIADLLPDIPDAPVIAAALFEAVLPSGPGRVLLVVTTEGRRTRISVYGDRPVQPLHGDTAQTISALTDSHGTTPDHCGLRADITRHP